MDLHSIRTALSLQTFEGHDAHMHSPVREGKRTEIGEEIGNEWGKAACFSVDSITAGKPEALKCPCSRKAIRPIL